VLTGLAQPGKPREWARWTMTLASAALAWRLAEQRARPAPAEPLPDLTPRQAREAMLVERWWPRIHAILDRLKSAPR
jgi:hypothetical protein